MDDSEIKKNTNAGSRKKTLAMAGLIAVCIGGAIGYVLLQSEPADGTIEISFRINDPESYPDDEPLSIPQTVVWIEDASGRYVQSILVSDWTSQGGWRVTVKDHDGTKIKKICPQWQTASGWPENHSKKVIDAVTKATPNTGPHKISIKCDDLKLTVGTYRYIVQTSVAPLHTITATGTINIGDAQVESTARITYNPEMHKHAGRVLSNVKASYTP
jgi:hypothetical protein